MGVRGDEMPATEATARPGSGRGAAAPLHRAEVTTSGMVVKIVLVGLVDALAVAGLLIAWNEKAWGYVALLAVTLVVVNIVYLPRRFVPLKYLVPGLFLLAVFALYPVIYTAYISTTNYGTGFVLSKSQAISQIEAQSVTRAEGAVAFDATALRGDDGRFAGYALYDPATEELFLGTEESFEPLEGDVELQVLSTTGRTFVVSAGDYEGVRPGELDELPGYPAAGVTFAIPAGDDRFIGISGGQAVESRATLSYDAARDAIVDLESGNVYENTGGQFESAAGERLNPGFTDNVGFANFREVLSGTQFRGDFVRVLLWNIGFATLSVLTTFGVGLLLAVVFNDERMRGRKIYRSLVIIPYALPAFMTALVWRGLYNRTYGVNRWLGTDIPWIDKPVWSMASLILVNLWLGYPYMFLVSTGALQSIPSDLKEAAFVDGATGLAAFRKVTFPLLLTAVSPLLIASFAFNFNNFTLVYLVTNGGPRNAGDSAGTTDILLSWTYRIALGDEPKQQGLGAALSVMIFVIVAVFAAVGFKYTKAYEEVR